MSNSKFANLRKKKKISQQSLAEKLFVPIPTIRKWEKGESIPPFEYIQSIASVFEVDVVEILKIFTPEKTKAEESDEKKEEAYEIIKDAFLASDNIEDFIFFTNILSIFNVSGLAYYKEFAFHFYKIISELDGTTVILTDNDKNQIILTEKNIVSITPISNRYSVYTFEIVVCCPIFPTNLEYSPKSFRQEIKISFFNS